MKRQQRIAWILILIVDVGYIAWGAAAAAAPDHLLGQGGKAILPAGYEGYSGASWSELAVASPMVAGYMAVLYRMYGIYNVLFGLMAASSRSPPSAAVNAGPNGHCSSATRSPWCRR